MCDHGCELALLQEPHMVGRVCVGTVSLHVLHAPTPTLQPHIEKFIFPEATSKTKTCRVYLEAGHVMARTTAV